MSTIDRESVWKMLLSGREQKFDNYTVSIFDTAVGLAVAFELRHANESLDYLVDYLKRKDPTTKEEVR